MVRFGWVFATLCCAASGAQDQTQPDASESCPKTIPCPDARCPTGFECVDLGPQGNTCLKRCDPSAADNACPLGCDLSCVALSNVSEGGACLSQKAGVGIGQPCAPELCASNGLCVGDSDDEAVCREPCAKPGDPCSASGFACVDLGKDQVACLPKAGTGSEGERCEKAGCAEALICANLGNEATCHRECAPKNPLPCKNENEGCVLLVDENDTPLGYACVAATKENE